MRGGVIVKAPLNDSLQLRCTTTGTTSASALNCSSNKAGDSITDGSVVWAVESLGVQFAKASHTHDYAPTSHNHSASNITSGTLPLSRGGTGQTSAAATRNALGLGNTTGALPIANGGTGATTAAAARANLGIKDIAVNGTDYIVETYQNGTEWYRKWKSGWVEQGGYNSATKNNSYTVTMLKAMLDTNYTLLGFSVSNTGWFAAAELHEIERTTTSITIAASCYNDNSGNYTGFYWRVEGMGA